MDVRGHSAEDAWLRGFYDALKEAALPVIKPLPLKGNVLPRQPAGTPLAGAFRNKSGPVAAPSATPRSMAPGPVSQVDARVPGT